MKQIDEEYSFSDENDTLSVFYSSKKGGETREFKENEKTSLRFSATGFRRTSRVSVDQAVRFRKSEMAQPIRQHISGMMIYSGGNLVSEAEIPDAIPGQFEYDEEGEVGTDYQEEVGTDYQEDSVFYSSPKVTGDDYLKASIQCDFDKIFTLDCLDHEASGDLYIWRGGEHCEPSRFEVFRGKYFIEVHLPDAEYERILRILNEVSEGGINVTILGAFYKYPFFYESIGDRIVYVMPHDRKFSPVLDCYRKLYGARSITTIEAVIELSGFPLGFPKRNNSNEEIANCRDKDSSAASLNPDSMNAVSATHFDLERIVATIANIQVAIERSLRNIAVGVIVICIALLALFAFLIFFG
ncbi:hypothetical protein [Salipiger sp. PrR003]|uniref:hypothetical protein n=1 Tax=Salipiger sp. PrR003 TaxID=2706776 RepID=UPI0013DC2CF1|nr:hypothetical protein [Salipiger sp. PrR003]NDV50764.1 hypothetical protein [Salipiger sp. PrR003]